MALTNNIEWAKTMMRLRSHGITSDPADMLAHPQDEIWNYQQLELGLPPEGAMAGISGGRTLGAPSGLVQRQGAAGEGFR